MFSESVVDVDRITHRGSVAREIDGLVDDPSRVLAIKGDSPTGFQSDVSLWSVGKGARWAEGYYVSNGFTTVLPPGSPSATLAGDPASGCLSASSRHLGGVNVAMADGQIRFIANSIDSGNATAPSVCEANNNAGAESPYGVWGALGTRASKEDVH